MVRNQHSPTLVQAKQVVGTTVRGKLAISTPLFEIAKIEKNNKIIISNAKDETKSATEDLVAKINLFSSNEATEVESILAIKARQIGRLQKEVKNLLEIQQQQARTIESSYHDSRDMESRIGQQEQQQKVYERTIRILQDRLADVTAQYQRILNSHVNSTEEKAQSARDSKKRTSARIGRKDSGKLEPVVSQRKNGEISAIGVGIASPLPPVMRTPSSKSEKKMMTPDEPESSRSLKRLLQFAEFCQNVMPISKEKPRDFENSLSDALCTLFSASKASFFILDKYSSELIWYNKDNKPVRFPRNLGIVGNAVNTGKRIRLISDVCKDENFDAKVDDRSGLKPNSMLCIPVMSTLGGVVAAFQVVNTQRSFTEDDELLSGLAEKQINILLQNYQVIENLSKERKNQDELLNACKAIASELDIAHLGTTIIDQTTRLLKCEGCIFYLVDSENKELCSLQSDVRFPISRGIVGQVASTGELVIALDAKIDSRFDIEVDQIEDKTSFNILCVPIKNDSNDVLAVIEMINKYGGNFSEKDVSTLSSLSDQIFESLSNAELFHKILSGFNAALSTQSKYQSLLEIAEYLSSQLDEEKLISFILKRARELVNAERCSLFLVDPETNELVSKVAEGTAEIRFPKNQGIAGHVASTGDILNIPNAYEDSRFNTDIDKQTGFKTQSLLCMPIWDREESIIGVTQLINKKDRVFEKEDEEILKAFSVFCGICLRNASLYKQAIQSQYKTKALLDVAVALSSEENIQPLLKSIMKHARKMVKADRASLFILDPTNNELRSQIADGTEEIRLPIQGIAGYVAQTGEEVAVMDAYKDPRFNPEIDKVTGYRTRSLLCIPIRNEDGKVIAVTQMINKREGVFHEEDKQLLKAFAAFVARSVQMLTVPLIEQHKMLTIESKYLPTDEDKEMAKSWNFDVFSYNHDGLVRVAIAMFENFNLIKQFNIPLDRLINLLFSLAKCYRDVPYHNFYHAVDVLQTIFLFLWHGKSLQEIFTPLEIMGLLIAALCHDVDHGGVNNAFHVKAQTPLAVLYKDTSVLETHHCARSITLLSEVENDILSGLSDQQYSEIWKVIIQTILATDMSLHFALLGQFENLTKNKDELAGSNTSPETRKLLGNILIKCSDISNVVKPFPLAFKWAEILCKEFFIQGDMEKSKGMSVSPLMDRDTVIIPQMQLGFINSICFPLYNHLSNLLPELDICIITLKDNIAEWSRILKTAMDDSKKT